MHLCMGMCVTVAYLSPSIHPSIHLFCTQTLFILLQLLFSYCSLSCAHCPLPPAVHHSAHSTLILHSLHSYTFLSPSSLFFLSFEWTLFPKEPVPTSVFSKLQMRPFFSRQHLTAVLMTPGCGWRWTLFCKFPFSLKKDEKSLMQKKPSS